MIELSVEFIVGICLGIVIPIILWAVRLHWITKRVLDMHMDPDEHGFGTEGTNSLIADLIDKQSVMHAEHMGSTKSLRYTIRELSHYVRWSAKHQTGKEPPPYVRNGN